MNRIGLALSGGGFRATLFHLGMIRFLREAEILPSVTHITSVSGGSILAAHLALNWQRFTGSLEEFDAAAAKLIRFVQLDIRNRVVRRYPLAMPLRALRRLALRRPWRQLTRTGLLEYHYEKLLYGDTCLFQLPERPRLFILATNLSEGCLCAFTRHGLLMQRRLPGQRVRFERIHTGLATVPMAVTASSAFPGFFPPLELQGQDVGADPGQFGRRSFTDGGIYDNLGVRMFRCLEQSWLAREVGLRQDDLADAGRFSHTLEAAAQASEGTPLRRLAQMVALPHKRRAGRFNHGNEPMAMLLDGLWDVMNHENLARVPEFANVSPADPDALALINVAQNHDGDIDAGEQIWLNRQLVDAAFRQATGEPCFRSLNACCDTILVSDAGKQFKISSNTRAGGVIATAMRSTDVIMDRVWQLETDTFNGTPGFVFAPISKVVAADEDPTALHPEVQRMATNIRTDLDRFSPLEISSLIQHGYCVGRSTCRARPDLFGTAIPTGAPWNPIASPTPRPPAQQPSNVPARPHDLDAAPAPTAARETHESRKLQKSSERRLWSTLLDYRDWTSYLYVPLLFPILFVLPYYGLKWYRQAQVSQRLLEGIAQSNQDFAVLSKLLQGGSVEPFSGLPVEEDVDVNASDYSGFEVITETRILDLRSWNDVSDERSWIYVYRRMRVKKIAPDSDEIVFRVRLSPSKSHFRSLTPNVPATLRSGTTITAGGKTAPIVGLAFDLSRKPVGEVVDMAFEFTTREPPARISQAVSFPVDVKTPLLTGWVLLPAGKQYQSMDLLRFPIGKGSVPERIVPPNEVVTLDGQIVGFNLLSAEPGYMYEYHWTYRN
jgi:predicted acylesterase/phospholipase RssA